MKWVNSTIVLAAVFAAPAYGAEIIHDAEYNILEDFRAIAGGSSGAKKGLAVGAVAGGLVGGKRRNDQQRREAEAQQQWEQQEAAKYQQARSSYNRAYGACMQGRGYTVS